MNSSTILRAARQRSHLTLRALARAAGTSHSTLAAYEAGRVTPAVDTLERIAAAAGYSLSVTLEPHVAPDAERSRELVDALEVAAQFPVRPSRAIDVPVFAIRGR